jgi:hypothetical protein
MTRVESVTICEGMACHAWRKGGRMVQRLQWPATTTVGSLPLSFPPRRPHPATQRPPPPPWQTPSELPTQAPLSSNHPLAILLKPLLNAIPPTPLTDAQ